MPKIVIILEVIGILILLLVYLMINNYIEIAALFMRKGVLLAIIYASNRLYDTGCH